MPQVVAAIAAGFSWAAVAKAVVYVAISYALAKITAPKKPNIPGYDAVAGEGGSTQVVRSAVATRRVVYGRAAVSGPLAYVESTGASNEYCHVVIPLAGHECEAIESVYLNDQALGTLDGSGNVTTGTYAGLVRVKKHLGTTSQAADSDLVAESAGGWTVNHRLRGVCYVYLRLKYDANVFANGLPNIWCVVKGRKVYDPRSATTAWSQNWALCLRDYLTAPFGIAAASGEIDDTAMIAAANVCDEQVALDAVPTYQPRYTVNGIADTGDKPIDIIRSMLAAAAGSIVFSQGKWKLYPGAYKTPAHTVDESWLRGAPRLSPDRPRRDLFNAVRGTYVSEAKGWQATDFPPVTNATYQTQDGGERIYKDVDLAYATDEMRAQRLGKIFLEQVRQGGILILPCNFKAFAVAVCDTVSVSLSLLGYSGKVFTVVGWKFDALAGVDLVLREEASAVYDWNYGEATVSDIAPNTAFASPLTVGTPGAPVPSESLYSTRDGKGVGTKVTLSWTASAGPYLRHYAAEWKTHAASAWTPLPPTSELSIELFDVAPGMYDFRVRAVNTLGVSSAWASVSNHEVAGLGAPPATPTIVGVQAAGGLAVLTILKATELDVLRGGRVRVRHDASSGAVDWDSSLSIGDEDGYAGDSTIIVLPLKAGTYFVKFEDSSGAESETAASFYTKQSSVLTFTNVDTINEQPSFTGSKTQVVLNGTALELGVDGNGDVYPTGLYAFADTFNFGAVTRVRVTGLLLAVAFAQSDTIDSRTANIDTWVDFDGSSALGTNVDAWLEARETDDDPGGSPTWSAWKRCDAGEFQCRAMQFRVQFRSYDPAYNISLDTASVVAEEL